MATFKVLLREDKLRRNGEAPLYLRITHARRSSYLHTDIWLVPSFWNPDRDSVRRTHPNQKKLNDDIRRQLTEAQNAYLTLKSQDKKVSAKAIKAAVRGSGEVSFFDYAEGYAKSWEQKSFWEYRKINVLLNKVRAFWKRKNLAFSDIDRDFLDGLVLHMRDVCQNKTSTQQKNLQILKSIIKQAVMDGLISPPDDPFNYYKIGSSKGSREKLPIETVRAMELLDLPAGSHLDIARDLFVFSFYNYGIRFGDLLALKWESVVDGRLNYVMMKSKKQISVKLKDSALGILEKYKPLSSSRASFIFPVLDPNRDYSDRNYLKRRISSKNARLNQELKSLAALVKTDVNVSFHVARHSFADYARSKGMPIYSISKALGHSNISTTEQYLKSMDQGAVDDLSDSLFD